MLQKMVVFLNNYSVSLVNMIDLPNNKKLVLFDGVCNLCNNSVLKIIKLDKNNDFLFTSLQSDIGKQIIKSLKIDTSKIDSIILYESNKSYYIKSSAILKIIAHFGFLGKLAQLFWIFPRPLRDIVYEFIAKNRYKWFGKKEECMIPTPEIREKFLS